MSFMPWVPVAARYEDHRLPLTPQCDSQKPVTPAQTPGPFYLPNSPERSDLREPSDAGKPFLLQTMVVNRDCVPLQGVIVELWHADGQGRYDTKGYRYRGMQLTTAEGRTLFKAIKPGLYPGRTPHFHVRLWQEGQLQLTTQLYFQGMTQNERDFLFNPALLMQEQENTDHHSGVFLFVIDSHPV